MTTLTPLEFNEDKSGALFLLSAAYLDLMGHSIEEHEELYPARLTLAHAINYLVEGPR